MKELIQIHSLIQKYLLYTYVEQSFLIEQFILIHFIIFVNFL